MRNFTKFWRLDAKIFNFDAFWSILSHSASGRGTVLDKKKLCLRWGRGDNQQCFFFQRWFSLEENSIRKFFWSELVRILKKNFARGFRNPPEGNTPWWLEALRSTVLRGANIVRKNPWKTSNTWLTSTKLLPSYVP